MRKISIFLLILITVCWGIALIPAIVAAPFSVMIFDAPGSPESTERWVSFAMVMSFPVLIVISVIGSAISLKKRKLLGSLLFCLFPLAPLLVLGVMALLKH